MYGNKKVKHIYGVKHRSCVSMSTTKRPSVSIAAPKKLLSVNIYGNKKVKRIYESNKKAECIMAAKKRSSVTMKATKRSSVSITAIKT